MHEILNADKADWPRFIEYLRGQDRFEWVSEEWTGHCEVDLQQRREFSH
jgi:hypothetical protein